MSNSRGVSGGPESDPPTASTVPLPPSSCAHSSSCDTIVSTAPERQPLALRMPALVHHSRTHSRTQTRTHNRPQAGAGARVRGRKRSARSPYALPAQARDTSAVNEPQVASVPSPSAATVTAPRSLVSLHSHSPSPLAHSIPNRVGRGCSEPRMREAPVPLPLMLKSAADPSGPGPKRAALVSQLHSEHGGVCSVPTHYSAQSFARNELTHEPQRCSVGVLQGESATASGGESLNGHEAAAHASLLTGLDAQLQLHSLAPVLQLLALLLGTRDSELTSSR